MEKFQDYLQKSKGMILVIPISSNMNKIFNFFENELKKKKWKVLCLSKIYDYYHNYGEIDTIIKFLNLKDGILLIDSINAFMEFCVDFINFKVKGKILFITKAESSYFQIQHLKSKFNLDICNCNLFDEGISLEILKYFGNLSERIKDISDRISLKPFSKHLIVDIEKRMKPKFNCIDSIKNFNNINKGVLIINKIPQECLIDVDYVHFVDAPDTDSYMLVFDQVYSRCNYKTPKTVNFIFYADPSNLIEKYTLLHCDLEISEKLDTYKEIKNKANKAMLLDIDSNICIQ